MGLSDIIEEFLLSTFDDEDRATISRNNLAEYFSCAPSQINYVLSTRFSPDRGYIVESKRGGNGYITVIRITDDVNEYLTELVGNLEREELSQTKLQAILVRLVNDGLISVREKKLIFSALSDKSFITNIASRNKMRAIIFRNIIKELIKQENIKL